MIKSPRSQLPAN